MASTRSGCDTEPTVRPLSLPNKAPRGGSAPIRVTTPGAFARATGRSRRAAKDRIPELRVEAEAAVASMLAAGNTAGAIGFAEGIMRQLELGCVTTDAKVADERQEEAEGTEDVTWARLKNDPTPARRQAWRRSAHSLIAATMVKLAAEAQ